MKGIFRCVHDVLTKLIVVVFLFHYSAGYAASCDNTVFQVGAGVYDITGPAAEEGMMGYGMMQQKTAGILQRLWARAFVIESPCNKKRIVFVNADLGQIFQAVKQQVILKLQSKYGNQYTDENVLLTATHTHSGPGGFSTYAFYNISTLGFSADNFNTIVNGIVHAISRAHDNLTAAHIKIASGDLSGISYNRSKEAYLLNPKNERQLYKKDVDTEMTLLRFDAIDGKPIGMINWFPLHGVSLNNKNHLIAGDNKGYAEYLFEEDFASDYGPHAFVAAFAESHAGDVSPNPYGEEGGTDLAGIQAVEKAGTPQYQKAKELYEKATDVVSGTIDFRHTFKAMDNINIQPRFANGAPKRTCKAAIGVSMLAGTQDGEGLGRQGVSCTNVNDVFSKFFCEFVTTSCQGEKPIAISTGSQTPYPWTPAILPLQLFQIGNVIVMGVPFEVTTMTGRRLMNTVKTSLPDAKMVVLSALSNAYAGYVATREEYAMQRYEGASTHFGPWQSAALSQGYSELAYALRYGTTVESGPMPINLLDKQVDFQSGVAFDDKPLTNAFGSVYIDVKPRYVAGETVEAIFIGGHPKNNYHTQGTFLEVQQKIDGVWKVIRRDYDWDTEYRWDRRNTISYSYITIRWRTPSRLPAGVYRIAHFGDWKSGWTGVITPYTGYSAEFIVAPVS